MQIHLCNARLTLKLSLEVFLSTVGLQIWFDFGNGYEWLLTFKDFGFFGCFCLFCFFQFMGLNFRGFCFHSIFRGTFVCFVVREDSASQVYFPWFKVF